MSAFLIIDTRIKNNEAYESYKTQAKPLAEKYGGVYRARGGVMDIRETDLWAPTRVVVVEFPNLKSAQAFVDSVEYAPIKAIRLSHADCTSFILDGD